MRKTLLSLLGGLILAGCSTATKVDGPRQTYDTEPARVESVEKEKVREEFVAMPSESLRLPAEVKTEEKTEEEKDQFIKGYFLTSTLKSKYIGFAGGVFNPNPCVQSIIGVNTKYGTIDLWTNVDAKNAEFTEVDPELIIPFPLGTDYLKGSFYASYFHFPQRDLGDLVMIGPTISTDKIPVDLSLTGYQLFGENSRNGQIFTVKVGKSFDLGELVNELKGVKIGASQGLSFIHKYYTDLTGFSHADTKIELSIPLSKRVSVSAFGQYNLPFKEFEDEKYEGFHGGLGFSLEF